MLLPFNLHHLVNLRTMTMADVPAGMRLKDLSGWNQTPADWERFLRSSPEGCFVAECDGHVCGTATTIVYENHFAWIGMVLVDPGYRGRGIGTRLLERAIEYLDGRGVPTLKLAATPQGKPIYEKLGFVAEYELERRILKRQPGNSGKAEGSCHKTSWAELSRIAELDRSIFGADRGVLLESLDSDAPAFTLVVKHRSELTGYSLGRRGSRADHLGPWVAQDHAGARALLDEFLRRSQRDTIFVDLMTSNSSAGCLLRSFGFELARPLTRMYRGSNACPGKAELICGILGPEFG